MNSDTHAQVQGIEEFCHLLKGEDVPVTLWYKNLSEAMRDVDLLTAFEFAEEKERKSVNMPILPQLFHMLRECLLNHRWSEALEVMKTVVNIPIDTSKTIWKVGTELLSMDAEENRDLIQQLFSQMRLISELNAKEVVMEFVTYLLGIGEDVEASTVMQQALKRHGCKKQVGDREEYVDKLHKAYLGLLWYLEWKRSKKKYEELERQQSEMTEIESLSQNPMQSEIQLITVQIKNFSDRAISCFKELESYPGIWDIFVSKHVELLVSEDEQMTAFNLLKNYCDNNAENLNAHKYLYSFCKQNYPDEDDVIQTLKVIAQLSPSDVVVLDLCTRLIKDGEMHTSIKYLFNLLDYSCWQMKEKPWKMLAKCLQKLCKGRSDGKEVVETCWSLRKSWWPAYHFTKHTAGSCKHEKSLIFNKAVVATLLCGKDEEFVLEARLYLTAEQIEMLP